MIVYLETSGEEKQFASVISAVRFLIYNKIAIADIQAYDFKDLQEQVRFWEVYARSSQEPSNLPIKPSSDELWNWSKTKR